MLRRSRSTDPGDGRRLGRLPAILTVAVLGAAILVALLLNQSSHPRSVIITSPLARGTDVALASNAVLDPGQPMSGPAPNFTLTDQFGRRVSLRSFRGKVVLLSFDDAECTTICPLTTTAQLDAKAMLGAAGRQVVLLGIDANPDAHAVSDVAAYSTVHGMLHAWDFLTGSDATLDRVWSAYHIYDDVTDGDVDHTPALYVISRSGQLAMLYLTTQSYSTTPQLAQLVARETARLLPGHPAVHSHLSYAQIPDIAPTDSVTVPTTSGGRIALGPGHARLLLFFDTWDREVTDLSRALDAMNAYAALARHDRLPALTAVDEGSVEPKGALKPFLGGLRAALHYPVAIDRTGRLADGYEVQGQPWLVLVDRTGRIVFSRAVGDPDWLRLSTLVRDIRVSLAKPPPAKGAGALAGSPSRLAALHVEASELLGGGYPALLARLRSLLGYPVVVNIWASDCEPCQAESRLLGTAAKNYGKQVAFVGADVNDNTENAQAFLRQHPVDYPSYAVTLSSLDPLIELQSTPTTVFIDRTGHVIDTLTHPGSYDSQGLLDNDIASLVDHR